jgi:hypothetical protein
MQKRGRCQGRGQGSQGGRGFGRGACGDAGERLGAGGFCVCPKCGQRVPHNAGIPCIKERCPSCGVALVREGSPHHQEIESRRAETEKAR